MGKKVKLRWHGMNGKTRFLVMYKLRPEFVRKLHYVYLKYFKKD
ncbi:hypothetical protein [Candidatus Methanodesulfokora washburnensis]|nr:hypothetical protein [Candidatus Methanodesulfokores washburnensis]